RAPRRVFATGRASAFALHRMSLSRSLPPGEPTAPCDEPPNRLERVGPMSEHASSSREPGRPSDPGLPAQPFLERLIREIAPSARLMSLLGKPEDHYTLRIALPDRALGPLILARAMVEHAEGNHAAPRALRGTLTAHIGPVGPPNVIHGYRGTRIPPDTPCTVCGQPIREGERPAVKQARIMHARCVTIERP